MNMGANAILCCVYLVYYIRDGVAKLHSFWIGISIVAATRSTPAPDLHLLLNLHSLFGINIFLCSFGAALYNS